MEKIEKYSNSAMSVIFIATFLSIFYFTYVAKVENQIVEDQVNYLIDDLTRYSFLIDSENKKFISKSLDKIKINMNDADAQVEQANDKIKKKALYAIGALNVVGLGIIYHLSKKHNFNFMHLVKDNLIILVFVALLEFTFLNLFAKKYISIDVNEIKLHILEKLS